MIVIGPKLYGSFFGMLLCIYAQSQVVINEICVSNRNDFSDNFGNYEDWIELYNPSATAQDISGFYLSDKPDDPIKWQIPAGTIIPPYGYLIVFADGEDVSGGGFYHSNFKITQAKQESVVFASSGGTILDQFQITSPTQLGHSRGRTSDGAASWSLFTNPTPGAANTNAVPEYVATPTFNLEAGFYTGAQSVSITTSAPNASIYYTTNGSVPTQTSTLYTGPVNITATTVLRAVAISNNPGVPVSFIATNTYFINVSHSVYVLSVAGDQVLTLLNGMQIEPQGSLELFGADGAFLAEATGDFNEHGNDSWAYDQRGMDYITRDEFGYDNELHYPVFRGKERDGFQRLILKAGASDNYPFEDGGALIRDAYVQSLSQIADLRLDERTYEPCVLYANGQYWGVYEIREKVDDHDFTDFYYDQDEHHIDYIKTWGGTWEEYGSMDEWEDLHDFILGNDMADPANYEYVKGLYNTGSLIDYFVLNSYVVCSDWLNWNTGWWRGKNPDGDKRKWRYTLWDMDATFGHYINFTNIPDQSANADICNPQQLGDPGGQGHVPIWNALLENPEFYADYINRMSDLSNTWFSCEFMEHHLDSLIALITPEMQQHVNRWGGSFSEWEQNVQDIYDFIALRCSEINENILGCYDLEGPFVLTVNVEPAGGGVVELNSLTLEAFPWSGSYFGGINQQLLAEANTGYTFSHWTYTDNSVAPDADSAAITLQMVMDGEVVAHFVPDVKYNVNFDVQPAAGGSIEVDGALLPAPYPQNLELSGSVSHTLRAIPAPGYAFLYWTAANHMLTPNATLEEVQLVLEQGDQITAYFEEIIYEVTFEVDPPGVATIELEGEMLDSLPKTLSLPGNVDLSLHTQPTEPYFVFSHWELLENVLQPDIFSAEAVLNLQQNDHVIAKYIEQPHFPLYIRVVPEGAANIVVNGVLHRAFPLSKVILAGEELRLTVLPAPGFEAEYWSTDGSAVMPSDTSVSIRLFPQQADTITAYLSEKNYAVFIPNSFSPNEDGINDIFKASGVELSADDFKLIVFDRWGQVLFESKDINKGWNGSDIEGIYYVPVGTYSYFIQYKNLVDGELIQRSGTVNLIR